MAVMMAMVAIAAMMAIVTIAAMMAAVVTPLRASGCGTQAHYPNGHACGQYQFLKHFLFPLHE